MKLKLVAALIVLAAGAFLAYRFLPKTSEVPTPSALAMAKRLEKILRDWESSGGDVGKSAGRSEESASGRSAPSLFGVHPPSRIPALRREIASTREPREVLTLKHTLARELLRNGQTRHAMTELEWLFGFATNPSLPAEVSARLSPAIRRDVAVTFLRMAEQENCLAMHSADSCIFPLQGGGVHPKPHSAEMAMRVLAESLEAEPGDLGSRWLLNVAAMAAGKYPAGVRAEWRIPPATFASDRDFPRFRDAAASLGINAVGLAGGCCVEDFDGDGDLDIIASSWGLRDQLRFFRQKDNGGAFEERTVEAGLAGQLGGLNICHADYDNDGAMDVLVLRGGWLESKGAHPNSLLRNLGDGRFDDVTERAGLLSLHPTQTAAWGDFDNDGRLDLFIGNEQKRPGEHPSQLFRNNGDGTFTDCAAASGVADLGYVKGVAWGDYDNDGFVDLYVSRIDQLNLLFRNGGAAREGAAGFAWQFTDVTEQAGVGEPRYSFPVWFWDYDNDGWLDLFAAGFDGTDIAQVAADYLGTPHRRGHPRLYRNAGDGTFRDVTREARLDRVLLVMGANYGDLDGDGFEDLYLGTGTPSFRTIMPNRMFRNDAGSTFQDVTTAGGFGHLQKGHGVAFADVDGDGDQDVYSVMGGWFTGDVFPNVLFRNPGTGTTDGRHWLALRLRGTRSNRAAFGARVAVTVRSEGGLRTLHRLVGTGGSFGSTTARVEIGLGRATAVEKVEIRWPGGKVETIEGVGMDREVEVREGES